MKKSMLNIAVFLVFFFSLCILLPSEESLFNHEIASSPIAEKIFDYIEKNKEYIIREWILLTEIPSPSGHEEKRAEYIRKQFEDAGFVDVHVDDCGNVVAIWEGSKDGKNIVFAAHMDTVFQDLWEIKVKREGNILKAPGIGDDTASCINMLWAVRALKHAGFDPVNNYYFIGTVREEIDFGGMRYFLDNCKEKIDMVIALDGNLGGVSYGALGFGGGKITFKGPGAHTMRSKGVPNPIIAATRAIDQIYRIPVPDEPEEKWTVYNVGMIHGGKVDNAVPQECYFTVDLRSGDQKELEKAQQQIEQICRAVAEEVAVEVELELNKKEKASQLTGARNSALVRTAEGILKFLKVENIRISPLGSTDANAGIERGIPSINLGRAYVRYNHSLREEAEIDSLFIGMKQLILMILSLG